MGAKVSLWAKIVAVILSIVFFFTSVISYFSLPLELVFFDVENYTPVLEEEKTQSQYLLIISETTGDIFYQSYAGNDVPKILSDPAEFKFILQEYIPQDWAGNIFRDFTDYSLDFLNFQTTESSLRLDISPLKQNLVQNSTKISADFVATLEECSRAEGSGIELSPNTSVYELPECIPTDVDLEELTQILALHLENKFKQFPPYITISSVLSMEAGGVDRYFNIYSVLRWMSRLMPLISLSILIFISLLLRKERKLMFQWVSRLLIFSSALTLLVLMIVLIGFDQFAAMLITEKLDGLVAGFDVLLLRLIQEVGYKTLIWVAVAAIVALVLGIIVQLISRLFKKSVIEDAVQADQGQESPKELKPENPQEIEEKEKKLEE